MRLKLDLDRGLIGGLALAIGLLLPAAPASALAKHVFSTSFGGSGASALANPTDVEVDQASGDVYVTDPANYRVEKFSPSGEFILMFGKEVNKTAVEEARPEAEQNLCTAASGDECQPGAKGSSPGAFTDPEYLAVDNSGGPSTGDVYVGDYVTGRGSGDVQKFDPQGNLIAGWAQGGLLDGSQNPDGNAFAGNGISPGLGGVAVDPTGNLILTASSRFFEYAQDGSFITDFTVELQVVNGQGLNKGGGSSLAVDSADSLYSVNRDPGSGVPGTSVQKLKLDGIFLGDPVVFDTTLELVDIGIDSANRDFYVTMSGGLVEHFLGSCIFTHEPCTPFDSFGGGHLSEPQGVAMGKASETIYVADTGNGRVAVFTPLPYFPDLAASATTLSQTSESFAGSVDPAAAGEVSACSFEYGPAEGEYSLGSVPCDQNASLPFAAKTPVSAEGSSGLSYGSTYHYRLQAENANGPSATYDQTFTTFPKAPSVGAESVSEVHADAALVHAQVNPNGGEAVYPTTYQVEYVDDEEFQQSGFEHAKQGPSLDAGSAKTAHDVTAHLSALTSNTTYHYRVVAANECEAGEECTTEGQARTFTTLPFAEINDTCANAHVRQQTSATHLLDCRAYELVSAADSGGYDVESNLIAGQSPFGSYPEAQGRVLYGVHGGGIPGTDHPTNRGVDPYVATRGEEGWSTAYVGIRADNPFSAAPFSSVPSGADAGLQTFAFGAPDGCSPCFEGGYTGIPLHKPNGELIQGMEGPEEPGPSAKAEGHIAKPLSAGGSHLIFGSAAKFTPDGNEGGDLTIYDRDLETGETHAVSKTPGGATMTGSGIVELDISADGSHILLGHKVTEDADHNPYYHLYMEVDDSPSSIDLTPGTTHGALYDGMSADGSRVFFTTKDTLPSGVPLVISDTDESADLYLAEVGAGSATLQLLSTGTEGTGNTDECDPVANSAHPHWNTVDPEEANCGAVAIGGGGGVASGDGSVYFLSPELLDGSANGTQDAPNLYVARPGEGPRYVTTLESILTGPQPPKLSRAFGQDFGSFTTASGLAVDHSSGYVYVVDVTQNIVERFDAEGNPVNFTASGTYIEGNKLTGTEAGPFGEYPEVSLPTQLAVAPNGDLYVPDVLNGVVDVFAPSGEYLAAKQISGLGFPDGVTVTPNDGHVYVSDAFGGISIYNEESEPISQFSVGGLPASVAVDSAGTIYISGIGALGEGTSVYSPSGELERQLDANPTFSVTVDPATGDVYVDEGEVIARYDSAGNRLESIGSGRLSGSVGTALGPNDDLYATTAGGAEVAVFLPPSLTSSPSVDNPAVLDSVSQSATRHTADFQVTPSGDFAAFPSTLALTGGEEDPAGHTVLYRYDAASEVLDCASCTTTGTPSGADSSLASDGLSLSDAGQLFFTTADQLVAYDTDNKADAYQWEPPGTGNCSKENPNFAKVSGACLALISAGTGAFDSGLLGTSADGKDAYFFSRDSLVPQDKNGPTMKIYDARSGGGFPYLFPPVGCKASDECHGVASPAPGPIQVRSVPGSPINTPTHRKCKPGFVRRHGKCVKKHHHHKRHHHRGGGK